MIDEAEQMSERLLISKSASRSCFTASKEQIQSQDDDEWDKFVGVGDEFER